MLPETLELRKRPITLIHHAANCGHSAPPGSLAALELCLDSGAAVIEIDVIPLADGSFALLHDENLAQQTSGSGKAPQMERAQIETLFYTMEGKITDEKVGFLENAVDLFKSSSTTHRLQLDLKPFAPLTQAVLRGFLKLIDPVMERIQVTSYADWAVRSLSRFAPKLSLGFDPLLYLDIDQDEPRPDDVPPFRMGAYGLRDDHPLSTYQWGPLGDYIAARAGALLIQAPEGCEWYIRAELLKMSLDAGFDWISFLHQQGAIVDGWTIDATKSEQINLACFLVEHNIDELTTDAPSLLATQLPSETLY